MKRVAVFIATAGPFGYSPVAPGTAGTMLALPISFALMQLGWSWQAGILVAMYFVSVWAAGVAEEHFREKDPCEVVIDEVLGYLVAMFALPPDSAHLALTFIAFRAADIIKPWPIRVVDQKAPGGWGIVTDDVMAGILANVIVRLIL